MRKLSDVDARRGSIGFKPGLKRRLASAAVELDMTLSELINRVMSGWLDAHGFSPEERADATQRVTP